MQRGHYSASYLGVVEVGPWLKTDILLSMGGIVGIF